MAKASTAAAASGGESYFECNICLDGVREPVVTRCGHLFCWPCLYRWLSTNQTECPVCKAGVTARNVIPLYGRGADNVDPRTKPTEAGTVPNRPEAERPTAERPRPANVFGGGLGGAGGWGGGGAEGGGVGGAAGGQVHFQAGLGFFPSLFGLQFQSFTTFPTEAAATTPAGGEGVPGQPNGENRPAGVGDTAEAGGGGGGGAAGTTADGSGVAGGGGGGSRVMSSEEVQQAFLSRLLLALGSFVVLCLVMF